MFITLSESMLKLSL